jgi:hypothetical protein
MDSNNEVDEGSGLEKDDVKDNVVDVSTLDAVYVWVINAEEVDEVSGIVKDDVTNNVVDVSTLDVVYVWVIKAEEVDEVSDLVNDVVTDNVVDVSNLDAVFVWVSNAEEVKVSSVVIDDVTVNVVDVSTLDAVYAWVINAEEVEVSDVVIDVVPDNDDDVSNLDAVYVWVINADEVVTKIDADEGCVEIANDAGEDGVDCSEVSINETFWDWDVEVVTAKELNVDEASAVDTNEAEDEVKVVEYDVRWDEGGVDTVVVTEIYTDDTEVNNVVVGVAAGEDVVEKEVLWDNVIDIVV